MPYIDGFVCAVPTANKELYRRYAEAAWQVFRDYGALSTRECWEDDVPEGKVTSFPLAVQRQPGESVVFSWIEWPDRAARDRCMAAMETEPRFAALGEMPLDGRRMIFGGFSVLLDASA